MNDLVRLRTTLSETGVLLWQGYILLFVRVQFYVPSFFDDFFVRYKDRSILVFAQEYGNKNFITFIHPHPVTMISI